MKYEVVIGLEIHVQARIKSKMFCACANEFAGEPNTRVCPVCLGYPGSLPVMNREAVRKTIVAGMMCHCHIASYSKFDRKSYYYPDMPKNYQISQYDLPLCQGGKIAIEGIGFSGEPLPQKEIGLTRIHLEEDVAKSMHHGRHTVVDFNRAGVPLLEIVTEPEISSPDEAHAFLLTLKQLIQFGEVGDCDMEKGQMRCDVNISLRPFGESSFGTKIEIKNLNSFRAVHRALEYEIERQTEVLNNDGSLIQETRRWNDDLGITTLMRAKEEAHDYRYFPDPDLMPVRITEEWKHEIAGSLPEAPVERRQRFSRDYNVTDYDASILTQEKQLADFFERAAAGGGSPKLIANWIITELSRVLNEHSLSVAEAPITPEQLGLLVKIIEDGTISNKIGKTILPEMIETGKAPMDIVDSKGLRQLSNDDEIEALVLTTIEENPKPVAQYREGNEKSLQFLVGQIMKKTKGKANPQLTIKLLKKNLGS